MTDPTSVVYPAVSSAPVDSNCGLVHSVTAPVVVTADPVLTPSAVRANRDKSGRFLPGASGNPSGRPKSKLLSDAYKRILEEQGADKYAGVIAYDAMNAPKASERLAAVQEMTDRTEGRPVQANVIGVGAIDEETARRIAEMMELIGQ